MGDTYSGLGQHADALAVDRETLSLRQTRLGPDHPDTLNSMNDLANDYTVLERHAEALKVREDKLRLENHKLGPNHAVTLGSIQLVASSLVSLDREREALAMIDDLLHRPIGKDVESDVVPEALLVRLRCFEHSKDETGCRATTEMFEKRDHPDPASLYNAACFRAVTAAVCRAVDKGETAARRARIDADRAMAWLEQAVAAGMTDAVHMKTDPDLASLRDREDFKKLLGDVERGVATKKK